MQYIATYDSSVIAHSGIKNMHWGVRRFQNPDGTWTEAGKKRYGDNSSDKSNKDTTGKLRRLQNGVVLKQTTKAAFKKKQESGTDGNKYELEEKSIDQMTDSELKKYTERVRLEANLADINAKKIENEKKAYESQLALAKLNGTYIEPKKKFGETAVGKLMAKSGEKLLETVVTKGGEALVKEMFGEKPAEVYKATVKEILKKDPADRTTEENNSLAAWYTSQHGVAKAIKGDKQDDRDNISSDEFNRISALPENKRSSSDNYRYTKYLESRNNAKEADKGNFKSGGDGKGNGNKKLPTGHGPNGTLSSKDITAINKFVSDAAANNKAPNIEEISKALRVDPDAISNYIYT